MEPRPRERPAFHPVAFVLLVLYAAALFLSALPPPVRPGFLTVPSELSEALLRRLAIRGGISVFEPPRERIQDVVRNDCIYVRGIDRSGALHWLQPPGGRCVTRGIRLWLPDLEWMLRSLLTGGEATQPRVMQEATLGDFFCHAPRWQPIGLREVELLWTIPRFDIDTGAPSTLAMLHFRWRCDPPELITASDPPGEAEVRAFFGSGG